VAQYLDGLAIYVNDAPVVSIPIAVCLFFMMYPIMVKIDFSEVIIGNPLTILWIAIPLFIQTMLIFWLAYGLARLLKLRFRYTGQIQDRRNKFRLSGCGLSRQSVAIQSHPTLQSVHPAEISK
jgi:ACR3 family arsenite efflux pump ArsB